MRMHIPIMVGGNSCRALLLSCAFPALQHSCLRSGGLEKPELSSGRTLFQGLPFCRNALFVGLRAARCCRRAQAALRAMHGLTHACTVLAHAATSSRLPVRCAHPAWCAGRGCRGARPPLPRPASSLAQAAVLLRQKLERPECGAEVQRAGSAGGRYPAG